MPSFRGELVKEVGGAGGCFELWRQADYCRVITCWKHVVFLSDVLSDAVRVVRWQAVTGAGDLSAPDKPLLRQRRHFGGRARAAVQQSCLVLLSLPSSSFHNVTFIGHLISCRRVSHCVTCSFPFRRPVPWGVLARQAEPPLGRGPPVPLVCAVPPPPRSPPQPQALHLWWKDQGRERRRRASMSPAAVRPRFCGAKLLLSTSPSWQSRQRGCMCNQVWVIAGGGGG